jgi:uncharacterized membrane protein YcaP (DUF421 family)
MDTLEDLVGVALRVAVMYLYALAILRIAGKRSLGAIAPHDFVMTLIVGDMFDDVFWAEIPLASGITGMSILVLLHVLTSYAIYRSKLLDRILEGRPVTLLSEGRFVHAALRKERVRPDETTCGMREQSVESPEEVQQGRLEPNGAFTFQLYKREQPAQKQDLPRLKELMR